MSHPEIKRVYDADEKFSHEAPLLTLASATLSDETLLDIVNALSTRFDSPALINGRDGFLFYLARDHEKLVVLKVVSPRAGDRQLGMFELETGSAAKLLHPHIVATNSSQELDGFRFSVLEHRQATETLKTLINREGWLEPNLAIRLARQITDALEYAHGLGVLHLRINPENILIDSDGLALITDFGLEKRSDLAWAHELRSLQSPIHYISPEQASGRPVDERSDLYSLGVVLYQMLTDRLPIASGDPNSVREKRLTRSASPPHLYRSEISLPLSALVTRLLEREPAKRFQDAASLRAALDEAFSQPSSPPAPQFDEHTRLEESVPSEPADKPSSSGREAWETPSITVMNAPDPLRTASTYAEGDSHVQPRERRSISLVHSRDNLPAKFPSLQTHSIGKPRPLIAMILLGMAAIGALIGLAVAARHRARSSTPVSPPAIQKKNGSSDVPSAESPANTLEGAPGDVREPGVSKPASGAEAARDVPGAGLPTRRPRVGRSSQPNPRAYSTSAGIRQAKRKVRPARHYRNPGNRGSLLQWPRRFWFRRK